MSEWVSLDLIDGVGPVAVKRRRPVEPDELLDHETAVLRAADHPGVVRVVERRLGADSALITHYVGMHSLATSPPLAATEAIRIIAGLVATLSALHPLGIRHGAIDESHVLLGPGRRPVLCGFSGATLPGAPSETTPVAPDDIAAVGRLIHSLLAEHDSLEPTPIRRRGSRHQWSGYQQRTLLSLGDHCLADDPRARPSASSLASSIDDLMTDSAGGSHPRRRRTAVVIGGAAAIATVAMLSPTVGGSPSAAPTAAPTQPEPPSACRQETPARGADLDGDGCADGSVVVEGRAVRVGAEEFVLGRRGDRVLIGDWACDGLLTPVLVRADPPVVWHFPTWATLDAPSSARPLAEAIDPASVVRHLDASGCDQLLATRSGSSTKRPVEVDP